MTDVLEGLDVAEDVATPETPDTATPPAAEPEKAAAEPEKAEPKAPEAKEARQIPLAAHLEERNKLRGEIEQMRSERKALEERLARLENPPKPPAPEPDYVADPKGYVDAKVKGALEQLNAEKLAPLTEQVEKSGKTAEQAAAESQFQRFMGDLASSEQVFIQSTPDYYDALGHLRTIRFAELQIAHPDATQEQIANAVRQEELQMAAQLMRQGRNPHDVAYQIAKARGYTAKAAAPAAPVVSAVPAQKQLPPDQSLGAASGGGDAVDEEADPFETAMKEMFRKRA